MEHTLKDTLKFYMQQRAQIKLRNGLGNNTFQKL